MIIHVTFRNGSASTLSNVGISVLIYSSDNKLLHVEHGFVKSNYIYPGEEYTISIPMKYATHMKGSNLRAAVIDGKENLIFKGRVDSFKIPGDGDIINSYSCLTRPFSQRLPRYAFQPSLMADVRLH